MIKTRKWKRQLKSFIARFLITLLVFSSFSIFSSSSLVYGQDNSIDNDPINFLICPPSQRVNVNNQYLFCIWTKGNYDTESERAKQINENFELLKQQIIDKNLEIDFEVVLNNRSLADYNNKEILDYLDKKDIEIKYYIDTKNNAENDTKNKEIKFCLDECNGVEKDKLTKIVSIDKLIQEYDNKIQEYSQNNDDQGNIIKRIFDALISATCYQNGMINAAKLDDKIVFCFKNKSSPNIEQFNNNLKELAKDKNTRIKSIKSITSIESKQPSNQENISFLKQYITGSNEQNKEKVIKAIAEYRKKYCTAPVNLGDEQLFCILSEKSIEGKIEDKKARSRAKKINKKVLLIAESNQIKTNDLIYQDNQNSFDIFIQQIQGNNLDMSKLMSVTNDDIIEDGRGLTIEELTKEYLQTISQAITSYRVKKDCAITKHQVIFNNQPLFCIKTSLNGESPQQRVEKVQEQIDKINQAIIPLDSLSIVKVSDLNTIIGSSQYDSLINNEENINEENPPIAIISQTEEWIPDKDKVVMIITDEDAQLIADGKTSTLTLADNYFLRIKEAVENYKPEEAWVTFNFQLLTLSYRLYDFLVNRNKIQYGFEKKVHKKLFFLTELDDSNYYNLYYRALSISEYIEKTLDLNLTILQDFQKGKKQLKLNSSRFNKKNNLTLTFDKTQFKKINLIQSQFVFDDYIKSIRNIIIDILVTSRKTGFITLVLLTVMIIINFVIIIVLSKISYYIHSSLFNNETQLFKFFMLACLRCAETLDLSLVWVMLVQKMYARAEILRFLHSLYLLLKLLFKLIFVILFLLLFAVVLSAQNIYIFINILWLYMDFFVLSISAFIRNDLLEIIVFFSLSTILSFLFLSIIHLTIVIRSILLTKKYNRKQSKILNSVIIMISVLLGIMIISPKLPIFTGFSAFIIIVLTLTTPALIGDLISGFILILGNIVNENNFIKTGDVVGKVEDQGFLVHKIRTTQNKIITISNIEILKNLVTNYSKTLIKDQTEKNNRLIIHISITLGYDVPWRKVQYMLIETAKNTNNILDNPEPFVWQKSLDDFYITYELNAYFDPPFPNENDTNENIHDMGRIYNQTYSDLLANIQDNCRKYNIELLSPHYQVNRLTEDGENSVIPPF